MAQLNLQQSAALGSHMTGLPIAFVMALIQEEGTISNGHNNPFDVTQYWASLYNQGGYLPGQGWGSQSGGDPNNPNGIASFTDTESGVQAWANGIQQDPNYAGVRTAVMSGTTDFGTLAKTFPSGYYGGSLTWVSNVINLAYSNAATGFVGSVGTTIASTTTAALGPGGGRFLPNINLSPTISVPGASDLANALNNIGTTLGQIPTSLSAPFVNAFNEVKAVGDFLGQPNLVRRALLLVAGGFTALVGLILFALSFVHTPALKIG